MGHILTTVGIDGGKISFKEGIYRPHLEAHLKIAVFFASFY
jgi:hypothetical protein